MNSKSKKELIEVSSIGFGIEFLSHTHTSSLISETQTETDTESTLYKDMKNKARIRTYEEKVN